MIHQLSSNARRLKRTFSVSILPGELHGEGYEYVDVAVVVAVNLNVNEIVAIFGVKTTFREFPEFNMYFA